MHQTAVRRSRRFRTWRCWLTDLAGAASVLSDDAPEAHRAAPMRRCAGRRTPASQRRLPTRRTRRAHR